jgi:transposase
VFTDMENWAEIRRRVLVDGLGKRAACRQYGIHYKTLKKVLAHPEPPAFRRPERRRPSVLGPLLPDAHQILKDDAKAPRKQRHTAVRIYRGYGNDSRQTGPLETIRESAECPLHEGG